VVRVCALHVQHGETLERFAATINPGKRVPAYVAQRLGLASDMLDDLPPFEDIVDDFVRFLGSRPVLAQDARQTWSFLEAEARRVGRVLAEPLLFDANDIATRVLELKGKPTLALVAAQLGISTLRIPRPEEEARVLALVATQLLTLAEEQRGLTSLEAVLAAPPGARTAPLRRGESLKSLPDAPGVYVLRDEEQTALYIGKARRLRTRLTAYVHRPLGATRRLEGLVGAVEAIDPTLCATDLEALILEDREIRRLQPRFNTVRQQHTPRVWIRLPPVQAPRPGMKPLAPRRLEPSLGPSLADGEFAGPFRNETAAEEARSLARAVFELDRLRRGDPWEYEDRLRQAWDFLCIAGHTAPAEVFGHARSAELRRRVLAFDLTKLLLPADPRAARYAVLRVDASGIEGFLIDHGVFRAWAVLHEDDIGLSRFAAELIADVEPRTGPDDVDVVLRWFGAQRPPAKLVYLGDNDSQAAADAIVDAASALARWANEP
jgi:DNA polymerase III epsilon subunit-like protein